MKKRDGIYLLLLFIIVFIANYLTPLMQDDYGFHCFFSGQSLPDRRLVLNNQELLESLKNMYWGANPRLASVFAHIYFTSIPIIQVLNIINSLFFVLLVVIISKIIQDRREAGIFEHSLTTFLLLGCMSVIIQFYFWRIGAFNYLWAALMNFVFLHILVNSKDDILVGWRLSLCVILAICAAWMQEAVSIPILATIIFLSLFTKYRFSRRKYILILFYTIGVGLIVLSPSTWSRFFRENGGEDVVSFLGARINTIYALMVYSRVFYILVISLLVYSIVNRKGFYVFVCKYIFWECLIAFSFFFFVGAGVNGNPRIVFPSEIFSTVLLVALCGNIYISMKSKKILTFCFTVLFLVLFSIVIVDTYRQKNTEDANLLTMMKYKNDPVVEWNTYRCNVRYSGVYVVMSVDSTYDWNGYIPTVYKRKRFIALPTVLLKGVYESEHFLSKEHEFMGSPGFYFYQKESGDAIGIYRVTKKEEENAMVNITLKPWKHKLYTSPSVTYSPTEIVLLENKLGNKYLIFDCKPFMTLPENQIQNFSLEIFNKIDL